MDLSQVTFQDRMLPVQPLSREAFTGDEQSYYAVLYQALMRFGGLRLPTDEFQLYTSDQVQTQYMASTPVVLRFLQLLILLTQPRRILEVGTFIGLSALSMAQVLPEDGRIVTIEKYDHFAALARRNFLTNGLAHKIQLIQGDAFEELKTLDRTQRFEMIFLDGNKERYEEYFSLLGPRLSPRGLLIVDDIFFHGDVLNEQPKSAKGMGVKKFLEAVERSTDYHKTILPIDSGLLLLLKRCSDPR